MKKNEITHEEKVRQQEIKDITESGVPTIRHIVNLEAAIMRNKATAAAKRGEYPRTGCPHPLKAVAQFEDIRLDVKRDGQVVNLYECTICKTLLWLCDPYGKASADGD